MKSDALLNTTIFVRFLSALYRDGGKCQVQDAKHAARVGKAVRREKPLPVKTHTSLTGNGLRRTDLLGLVMMLLLVMPLGVVTMCACGVSRERTRCEHAEYHRRQKKSHKLAHTSLSLICFERYVSEFDTAVRRPHDTARRTRE